MNWLARVYSNIEAWLLSKGFSVSIYANSLHLYISFMLIIILTVCGVGVWASAGIVLLIGIIKEVIDWKVRGNEFSMMDILFDCIGISIGVLFCGGIRVV